LVPAFLLGRPALAVLSLGLFAVAYGCWQLDKRGRVLGLWGHAMWHTGTAVAIGVLYLARG